MCPCMGGDFLLSFDSMPSKSLSGLEVNMYLLTHTSLIYDNVKL